MADIQLRFGKDLLVIGGQVQEQLANTPSFPADDEGDLADITGGDLPLGSTEMAPAEAFDTELALVLEPEVFEDAFALEKAAGAQCLVAPTANLTPARLAHTGMRAAAEDLARAALQVAAASVPEHVLVEIGPCGLPLDAASKSSLMENRSQYERAARLFDGLTFDAFFLNGFTRVADLKCALMGIRKVSDAPVLASVDVNAEGMLCPLQRTGPKPFVHERLEEAVAVMAEYGAQVAGFCTAVGADAAAALAGRVANTAYVPVLAQLFLRDGGSPDDGFDAALLLAQAGVQFLRATGAATPAYTGAMAAAVFGMTLDERRAGACPGRPSDLDAHPADLDPAQLADRLRQSVNDALGIGGDQ